jgi:mono/diheme cytochrome c family protein
MKRINFTTKSFSYLILCALYLVLFSSCGKKDPNSAGVEFMPDMYRSPSLETYSQNNFFADSMSARRPVPGTIPVSGYIPYPYPNDTAGYSAAGKFLKNPIPLTPEILADGEKLFKTFCIHCHGAEGKGDGTIVANGKFPGAPPSYSGPLKNLPEGKIFHTLMYGKGLMGSHASQLSQEERWKLVHYVQKLQKLGTPAASADTTANKAAAVAGKKS